MARGPLTVAAAVAATVTAATVLAVAGVGAPPSTRDAAPPVGTSPVAARARPGCARDRAPQAARCGRCHATAFAQWRTSGHARAFVDPVFRAEHDPAPSTFCTDCHAHGRARFGHEAHDGVDCSSCHPPHADPSAPRWQVCADCHQFDFDADAMGPHGVYDPADPLQDTIHEWSQSSARPRGIDCIDCHMPRTDDGRPSHRFVGASDAALVRRALRISARAEVNADGLEVIVTLAAHAVGHRVPTGDVFRRLRVAAWPSAGDGEAASTPEAVVERWLGRHFAHMPSSSGEGFRLRPVLDDRVPAPGTDPPVEVRLQLPTPGREARWSVELHRMPPDQARARGLDPDTLVTPIESGIVTVPSDGA